MRDYLEPIYLEEGKFYVNKNLELPAVATVLGPVSFLFSCSLSELKKNNQAKVSLPGMFHVIQIYFSILENKTEDDGKIFKLDYMQDVIEKYAEALSWMKESSGLDEIIICEKLSNRTFFNDVVMKCFKDLSDGYNSETVFRNEELIQVKFFINSCKDIAV